MQSKDKFILLCLVIGALASTVLARPHGHFGPFGGGTNAAPVWGTNVPPAWGTNAPGTFTHPPPNLSTNAATDLSARAAVAYAALVPYDTTADGTLDPTEQTVLASALTNGLVPVFGTNQFSLPPQQAAEVTTWLAGLYSVLVSFDVDKNGALDATEQAALAAALENNTVSLPLFAPLLFHQEHQGGAPAQSRQLIWRP